MLKKISLMVLALPVAHRALSSVYAPQYFNGRAKTSHGILGDPINLAFLNGTKDELSDAMEQAAWVKAKPVTMKSSIKTVTSTVLKQSYPDAPVSPLEVFGRQQDMAFQQEIDGDPTKRHHVRFWKCPDGWKLPGGIETQWLASGTCDVGIGLSWFTLGVTHRIAPEVDKERDHIIKTLKDAGLIAKQDIIYNYLPPYKDTNGGGDKIVTDGHLPLLTLKVSEH
ncbi:MAG: LssY C-terminal domain-containing protein [Micrococcaceae bacterium]